MSREDDLKRLFGALFGMRRDRSFRGYHDFSSYPEDADPEAFEDADFNPRPPDVNDEDGNPLNLLQIFEIIRWVYAVSVSSDGFLTHVVRDEEQASQIAESMQDENEEVQVTSFLVPTWLAEKALNHISNLGSDGYSQSSKLAKHALRSKEISSWTAWEQDFDDLSETLQENRREQIRDYHLDWGHVAQGTKVYTSTDDPDLEVFFAEWSKGDGSTPMVVTTDRLLIEELDGVVETGYPRAERRMLTFMVKRDLIRVSPEDKWIDEFKEAFNIDPPGDDGERIVGIYREDIHENHPGHPDTRLRGKSPEALGVGPWFTLFEASGDILQLIAVDLLP